MLKNIVKSSITVRVEELYFKDDVVQWVTYNSDKLQVEMKEEKTNGEVDLFDKAMLQTLINGGKVKVIEDMPEDIESNILAYL